MPYGLLVPSETIWNSRVRGCTRHSAQLNLYSLPLFERMLALIEHAVQSVEPSIRSPRQRIRQLMRVRAAKASEHHFAADFLAILLAQEEKVGRVEHPHAAVANRHAGGNIQSFGKDSDFVRAPIGVRVFQNFHAIAPDAGGLARILDAFGNPNAPAIIESHRDGIDDVRFAGDEFDREPMRAPSSC